MKAYIGCIKDENKRVVSVLSLTDSRGVVLHRAKKTIEKDIVRFESDLLSIVWGISKIKKLMQNGDIPNNSFKIFIGNKTVYGWIDSGVSPKEFVVLLGDVLIELSFMENNSEIINSTVVDSKLKIAYKGIKSESDGVKVSELFKDK